MKPSPVIVSPGCANRGARTTRSMLMLPTTVIGAIAGNDRGRRREKNGRRRTEERGTTGTQDAESSPKAEGRRPKAALSCDWRRMGGMRSSGRVVCVAGVLSLLAGHGAWAQPGRPAVDPLASRVDPHVARVRMLVLTDIANEPDDQMSLVRLLVYGNHFDIEGLVATTSTWLKTGVRPDVLHTVLDAYAQVQPNLLRHAPGFPAAADLKRLRRRRATRLRHGCDRRRQVLSRCGAAAGGDAARRPAAAVGHGVGRRQHAGAGADRRPRAVTPEELARTRVAAARVRDLRSGRCRRVAAPRVSRPALHRRPLDAGRRRSTRRRPGPASAATGSTATRPVPTSAPSPTRGWTPTSARAARSASTTRIRAASTRVTRRRSSA